MKTKLVAIGKNKKSFIFGSRRMNPGDTFMADGQTARTLKALGWAKDALPEVAAVKPQAVSQTQPMPSSEPSEDIQPQRRVYRRREVTAEAPAEETETEEMRPRRQYRRRDLTAEE